MSDSIQPKEQRKVAFELPAEVCEALLEEFHFSPEIEEGESFWILLQSYYHLSPIQGDSIICSPDFSQFIEKETGCDNPPWVYEQVSLKKMQCMIIAGVERGQVLLDTLKMIESKRDEGERQRKRQLEEMFHSSENEEEDTDYDYLY